MTNFLQRYNVGKRLTAAFTVLILLSLLLVIAGVITLTQARQRLDSIVNNNMASIRYSNEMLDTNLQIALNLRNILLPKTQEQGRSFLRNIEVERKRYADVRERLYAIPAAGESQRLRDSIDQLRGKSIEANDKVLALDAENRPQEALAAMMGEADPATQHWQAAIRQYVAHQIQASESAYAEASTSVNLGRTMLVSGGLAVLLVSGLLAWLITRSLSRPLAQATRVAEAIANGNLDNDVSTQARDETGRLLMAMGRMQQQLRRFSSETVRMIELHAGEDMSHRIPEDFPGVYGELAQGINTMMFEHLDAIVDAIEVLNEYAVGDLSRDARRLPGTRAVLHQSMDAAKASLLSINNEIKRLAQAAAAGDFSVRGDAARFDHDFALMVNDLNSMMDVSDANLGKLSTLLAAIAKGDLTARMHGEFQGVFARLRDDANATADQLAGIVGRIQQASGAINTAAGEIAAGNEDLSRRTEQQAANLEETAASMEELTSTVRQNAESARQANQLTQGAAGVAQQGGEVVGQVVTTMSAIETSSRKIAEIISVIDGIAFQTNILALNAAVEAARAGEQGRGFAVVASEVRTLAQRSANAAKEIKGLIDDSVGKVADGSALVHKAGATMGEIVTSVQRVTDIMAEISAASQEQSAGIEQVNQTVTQMDETTQQNAALVEEATAAARAMAEQAEQLDQAVAIFRIGRQPERLPSQDTTRTRAATPAPQRPATAPRPRPAALAVATETDWQEF